MVKFKFKWPCHAVPPPRGLVGAKNFWDSIAFKALLVVAVKVLAVPLIVKGVKVRDCVGARGGEGRKDERRERGGCIRHVFLFGWRSR